MYNHSLVGNLLLLYQRETIRPASNNQSHSLDCWKRATQKRADLNFNIWNICVKYVIQLLFRDGIMGHKETHFYLKWFRMFNRAFERLNDNEIFHLFRLYLAEYSRGIIRHTHISFENKLFTASRNVTWFTCDLWRVIQVHYLLFDNDSL